MLNVFSSIAIIWLHCRMGFNWKALLGFHEMQECRWLSDDFVDQNALKACSSLC